MTRRRAPRRAPRRVARPAGRPRRDDELRRAKERLDLALEASGVALWDNDVPSNRVYLSRQWAKLMGKAPRQTVLTVPALIKLAHPDDQQRLLAIAGDAIRGRRESYEAEHRVLAADGTWKWILSRGKVVERGADGRALRIIGTNVDITARKIHEQSIARRGRIHALLSSVNAAIMRTRDRVELLREACRLAVAQGGFAAAWVGLLDATTRAVVPVAWEGFDSGPPRPAKADEAAGDDGDWPTVARAVRERRTSCEDLAAAETVPGAGAGFRAVVSLPLVAGGETAGTLTLLAREAESFDAEATGLLSELGADIAFALRSIERQDKVDYLSYYDVLTALPNRPLFLNRAAQQMRLRGGDTRVVAIAIINLERFRNINETYGRNGGDALLNAVAQRLVHAFQGKDCLARVGADSFGLVLRGLRDAAAVAHVVERQLLTCFRDPFTLRGSALRVAAKAGIALFPLDGTDVDVLFNNAEAALKRAGESGERCVFYSPEMNARAAQAVALETRLREAVERQQFVLHYQPKVEVGTGVIQGIEALLRWDDPEEGLVPPMRFIPLLEETGLILEVGNWAIRSALAQRTAWRDEGLNPPRVAVNVSAIQLRRQDFVDTVRDCMARAGAGPDSLDLEMTESLVMADVESNIDRLRALRDSGVKIAIDDFGTGYSSLGYLAQLPVDELKIDRAFIGRIAEGTVDMTIVSSIISLAHALGIEVVAEGVETSAQLALLRAWKCDLMQGYLVSRPVPAADIPPFFVGSIVTAKEA